ncbi:two-partner secretion domain-containing protein [Microseira wollei]|uniref:two-partner secretion domain-containing protein n=1 Tax=Microseira wollei TaxID=467598 RepID=UPI001CFF07CD|nr:filamentous hemagglutinin N-terminal domain-containing protein [Microseira wollei]
MGKLKLASAMLAMIAIATNTPVVAQIVPDSTLPHNSRVTEAGNTFTIEGGTSAGGNLFHSLREFSLTTGSEAFFNNALTINNIITRVTGGQVSHIDGLIRANGGANLFLINPSGIIFGANAQLNIGGAFIGSTADSIRFADGSTFSAKNPQNPPLLTINVPIGLQFGSQPANIINQSQPVGLAVQPGQTLALIGGNVNLVAGWLTAPQGRIELGSVGSNGEVSIAPGWVFGYLGVQNFGDIQLSQQAGVVTNGGDIQVQGRRLAVGDRSIISTSTLGSLPGGNLTIRTTDAVEITGTGIPQILNQFFAGIPANFPEEQSGLFANSFGVGSSGNLTIETGNLTVRNGAMISSANFSPLTVEPGGNLTVTTASTGTVQLNNAGLISGTFGMGKAGDLTINTGRLRAENGAFILGITFGSGAGGNISINAKDAVETIGIVSREPFRSGIIASVGLRGVALQPTGQGGDVTINTNRLLVQDGAVLSAGSYGIGRSGNVTLRATDVEIVDSPNVQVSGTLAATSRSRGDSGDILIQTNRLRIGGGADVSVTAFGEGKSGNLTVNASEFVDLFGARINPANPRDFSRSGLFAATEGIQDGGSITVITPRFTVRDGARVSVSTRGRGNQTARGGRGGNLNVIASESVEIKGTSADGRFESGLFALSGEERPNIAANEATGDGGNLFVETNQLNVRDRAEISVSARGSGAAGNLQIRAQTIALENRGRIATATASGSGGNINLQVGSVQLRSESQIAAAAGGTGNGGNITLTADTVALLEESGINANAFKGSGGQIDIFTQGIFRGFDSEIAASSQFGVNGIVTVNTPNVNTSQGLVELPTQVRDNSNQVIVGCRAAYGNSFTITFRGGLPEDPTTTIRGQTVWRDLQDFTAMGNRSMPDQKDGSRRRQGRGSSSGETFPASERQSVRASSSQSPPDRIVEATGWIINASGQIELVEHLPQSTPNCLGF